MKEVLIQACKWKFQIQCPKRWETLHPTEDDRVRMCEVCMKEVTKCDTDEEVTQAAAADKCVAITIDDGVDDEDCLVGVIDVIDETE